MTDGRSSWKQKLLAAAASTLLVFIVLGLGELYCRYFLDINLRKTTRDFVVTNDAGRVVANRPNASGVSFGVPVYSDVNGFRVPENYSAKPMDSAVLLVGDSVTFGVGVPEEKTFAGLLRKSHPEFAVYNSGVIGFSVTDYKLLVDSFVPDHNEVKQVYLFYCLNDFVLSEIDHAKGKAEGGVWRSVKRTVAEGLIWMNEFFGARSKLYVFLTGISIDPAAQYYALDAKTMDVDDGRFQEVLQPLVDISRFLDSRKINFAIVLSPYERQLRGGGDFGPQDRLRRFFEAQGIRVIDIRDRFRELKDPKEGFLFADPMHLSETGHTIVFEALKDDLASGIQNR